MKTGTGSRDIYLQPSILIWLPSTTTLQL